MKLGKRIAVVFVLVAMLMAFLPYTFVSADISTSKSGKGYMVGNSLTISMSPRRFRALLKTQGYDVTLGGQLLGDTSLPEHVGMRLVGDEDGFTPWNFRKDDENYNPTIIGSSKGHTADSDATPGLDATINGRYFQAMAEEAFDFVSLQTYGSWEQTTSDRANFYRDHTVVVEAKDPKDNKEYFEYQFMGDRETIGLMINYALNQQKNGKGSDTFLIYESWTFNRYVDTKSDVNGDGIKGYADFYNAANYTNPSNTPLSYSLARESRPNAKATSILMEGLLEDFAYLPENSIRLVPASAIWAHLDEMIINGELPGFKEYMERNAEYYLKSRAAASGSGVDKDVWNTMKNNAYTQELGIRNLYVDDVHMCANAFEGYGNGWHSGVKEGTLASYITCIAMYSVLTGYSPVGLPVDMGVYGSSEEAMKSQFVKANPTHDARLDATADAELIRVVQEAVFDVLCELSEYTGISEDAPQRITTSGNNGTSKTSVFAEDADQGVSLVVDVAKALTDTPVLLPAGVACIEADIKGKED